VLGTALGVATGLTVLKYRNDLLHFLNDRCGMQLLPEELYHLAELPAHTLPGCRLGGGFRAGDLHAGGGDSRLAGGQARSGEGPAL
jgi:hypothetical protein